MLEARAYNNSIYLMVATPYVLLGGMGLAFFGVSRRRRPRPAQPPVNPPSTE
jgi:hypothetical protein